LPAPSVVARKVELNSMIPVPFIRAIRCTGEIPETAKKTIKVKEKLSKKQAALNARKAAEGGASGPSQEGVAVVKAEVKGGNGVESDDEDVEVTGKDDER